MNVFLEPEIICPKWRSSSNQLRTLPVKAPSPGKAVLPSSGSYGLLLPKIGLAFALEQREVILYLTSWLAVLRICLSSGFYCCEDTMTKTKLRRKGFIWLTLPHYSLSLKEGRTGTQTGQEPGGRSWCRGHGGVLLTGLLPMAWWACFLIECRST